MADTVDTKVLFNGSKLYVVRLTNLSDGTGESAVIKVDISTLTGPDRVNAPSKMKVREINYNINGFTYVRLLWDATTDDEIAHLPTGSGYIDLTGVGGSVDPKSTGATGDILLTTGGAASGATYDITLVLEKKQ
jgi:hypothetical protein